MLRYLVLQDIKYYPEYGLPGRTTTEQTYTISGCANGVRFTLVRYSVSSLREAHLIFSLAISVLEHYTANNVMSCFSA